MRFIVSCLVVLFAGLVPMWAWGQRPAPTFGKYPAAVYKGPQLPVKILPGSPDWMFRTRLLAAAKQKPNFAGHYILTAWGCGGGCLSVAVIDVKTGQICPAGLSVCCWPDDEVPVDFQLNSRLVVFNGLRNEEGSKGPHYYTIQHGQFIALR